MNRQDRDRAIAQAAQELTPFVTIMARVETDIDSLCKIDTHLTYEQAAKHVFYGLAWSIADDVNNGTEIHPDRLARYRYIRQIVQGY